MEDLLTGLKNELENYKKDLQKALFRLKDIRQARESLLKQEQEEIRNIDRLNGAVYALDNILNPKKAEEEEENGKKKKTKKGRP